jgi:hypothetical protein
VIRVPIIANNSLDLVTPSTDEIVEFLQGIFEVPVDFVENRTAGRSLHGSKEAFHFSRTEIRLIVSQYGIFPADALGGKGFCRVWAGMIL